MIVVTMTDCPPRLRGDLSKWLMEISTGVYVGNVNTRVRDELWKRIKENLANGRATMVFSANNEQRLDFYVHNTSWVPADYDGLKLIRRPLPGKNTVVVSKEHTSNAAAMRKTDRISNARARTASKEGYVVLDLETTGLRPEKDEILEIGALRIVNHQIQERMCALVQTREEIPKQVQVLTGITMEQQSSEGISLSLALDMLMNFMADSPVVCHNAKFERQFLREACLREEKEVPKKSFTDTLALARRYVEDVPDYKLSTLAAYFNYPQQRFHRAIADCEATFFLYEKLNEIR